MTASAAEQRYWLGDSPPEISHLLAQEILAGGRLTSGQLDSSLAELREHLSQPGTLTCLPTIWQAWGSKPRPGQSPPRNVGQSPARNVGQSPPRNVG